LYNQNVILIFVWHCKYIEGKYVSSNPTPGLIETPHGFGGDGHKVKETRVLIDEVVPAMRLKRPTAHVLFPAMRPGQ